MLVRSALVTVWGGRVAQLCCRRGFVDVPDVQSAASQDALFGSAIASSTTSALAGSVSADGAGVAAESYSYPLDSVTVPVKLYGELTETANQSLSRVFATGPQHSYDAAVLAERATAMSSGAATDAAHITAGGHPHTPSQAAADESIAIMKESRDKQGAAGAAAVAAAMLESRRAMDGIAMVPGHPLPVVFPRPDGLPPPLRFVQKFSAANVKRARSDRKRGSGEDEDEDEEEEGDAALRRARNALAGGQVLCSDGPMHRTSVERTVHLRVQVLDAGHTRVPTMPVQYLHALRDVLPRELLPAQTRGNAARTVAGASVLLLPESDPHRYGLLTSKLTTLQSVALPLLLRPPEPDLLLIAPRDSGQELAFALRCLTTVLRGRMRRAAQHQQQSKESHSSSTRGNANGRSASPLSSRLSRDAAQPLVLVLCRSTSFALRMAALLHSLMNSELHTCIAMYPGSARYIDLTILPNIGSAQGGDNDDGSSGSSSGAGPLACCCDVWFATPHAVIEAVRRGQLGLCDVRFAAVAEVDALLEATKGNEAAREVQELHTVLHDMLPHDAQGQQQPQQQEEEHSSKAAEGAAQAGKVPAGTAEQGKAAQSGRACQITYWAETPSEELEQLARRHTNHEQLLTVLLERQTQTHTSLTHILYPLPSRAARLGTIQALYDRHVIEKHDQVVIYCVYKRTAQLLAAQLVKLLQAPPALVKVLHSGVAGQKRRELLRAFGHGDIRLLLVTDVGMQRMPEVDVEHIIHYELPFTAEIYLRRIHHAGRASRPAVSHTFFAADDTRVPVIAAFMRGWTGRELSPELTALVARLEAANAAEDTNGWRLTRSAVSRQRSASEAGQGHTRLTTRWRIRGRHDLRGATPPSRQNLDGMESDVHG